MHHGVHGAECPVAVAADTESGAIDDPLFVEEVDHCGDIVSQIVHIIVVHAAFITHNRSVRLDHGVPSTYQNLHRARTNVGELILVIRFTRLVVGFLVRVLARIEPQHSRQPFAGSPTLGNGHVQGELEPVDPRHLIPEPLCACDIGRVIRVLRKLVQLSRPRVPDVRIGRIRSAFSRHE